MTVRTLLSFAALALALAACEKKPAGDVAKMDKELVANASDADPALTSALQDQIMVDPDLVQQSNDHSARPAGTTRQAPVPPGMTAGSAPPAAKTAMRAPAPKPTAPTGKVTLAELAEIQAKDARTNDQAKGCAHNVQYSAVWASRMPVAIPLYPDARVVEAAGNDTPGCRLRVVSFTSAAPMQRLLDWYYTVAIRAGFTSEHQAAGGEHILAGVRESDDGAYYIFFNERAGGGTEVDLITKNGR